MHLNTHTQALFARLLSGERSPYILMCVWCDARTAVICLITLYYREYIAATVLENQN